MSSELRLSLLGSPEVYLNGKSVGGFRSSKARALLYYLAQRPEPHQRSMLAGLLWSDVDEQYARASLNQTVSNLRQLMGEHLIIERSTLSFNDRSAYSLDTAIFEANLVEFDSIDDVAKATELYRGEFLEGFYVQDAPDYEQWVLLERTRLHDLAIKALAELVDHFDRQHAWETSIGYARRILALESWREETHRALMRLLAQSGQRSTALAQYEICRQILADELAVEPTPETVELARQIRTGRLDGVAASPPIAAPSELATVKPQTPPLPSPPTSFIGRRDEVETISRLITHDQSCRLLTLNGPGGMGKTRLSLEVASTLADKYSDGVAFVELASISSPAFIPTAIADALGISFAGTNDLESQLQNALRSRDLLIVLDNFEHLLAGADLVSELLAAAPNLQLLVTSRERLNIHEEWNFSLHGMDFPSSCDVAESELLTYSAVQLFLQCARKADAHFSLDAETLPYVVQICELVDGMPLGIEMAAAWVHTLSCQEIAEEIERGLDFLTTSLRNVPERHRSLRAVFEQTWRRLTPAERDVLCKLSIFPGGCTRQAAAAIAQASLSQLAGLVDKAVLRRSQIGRYDMHGLLRQYAQEKLNEDRDMAPALSKEYCRYYAEFARQSYQRYLLGEFRQVITDWVREIDNLREAWDLLLADLEGHKIDETVLNQLSQSIKPMAWFYVQRALFSEGIHLFERALASLKRASLSPSLLPKSRVIQARLLIRLANMYYLSGEYDKVRPSIETALPIVRGENLTDETGLALAHLAQISRRRGNYEETRELTAESEKLFRQTNNKIGLTFALGQATLVAADQGNYAEAESSCKQVISFYRDLNDSPHLSRWLANLANTYIRWGKHREALPLLQEARDLAKQDNNSFSLIITATNMATVMRYLGDYVEAERYLRESLHLSREIGNPRWTSANLDGLCRNYLEQQDWTSAVHCALEALDFAHSIHSDVDSLSTISRLAQAWANQDKRAPAFHALLYIDRHPSALQYDKENNAELLETLQAELDEATIADAEAWVRNRSVDGLIDWVRTQPT